MEIWYFHCVAHSVRQSHLALQILKAFAYIYELPGFFYSFKRSDGRWTSVLGGLWRCFLLDKLCPGAPLFRFSGALPTIFGVLWRCRRAVVSPTLTCPTSWAYTPPRLHVSEPPYSIPTCRHVCIHAYMLPRLHTSTPTCLHASMLARLHASIPPHLHRASWLSRLRREEPMLQFNHNYWDTYGERSMTSWNLLRIMFDYTSCTVTCTTSFRFFLYTHFLYTDFSANLGGHFIPHLDRA